MYKELSEQLYNKFVVNKSVVAVQRNDGRYVAIKSNFDSSLIEQMLKMNASLGTYQQQTYRDTLKWVCLDFDCKNPDSKDDLIFLKDKYIDKLVDKLKVLNINFLLEFSGRRGFHVWIIFDEIISKDLGYRIVSKLCEEFYFTLLEEVKFGLDLFPKVPSSKKKNKYGLQVKIPLSKHKRGMYSYFINVDEKFDFDIVRDLNEQFMFMQLTILNSYKTNRVENVLTSLNIDTKMNMSSLINYHRQFAILSKEISIEEIEIVFKSDKVLSLIWDNILRGEMTQIDRLVFVGIFGHINSGSELLTSIFMRQRNYDEMMTRKMISKHLNYFFPVTFEYLYQIYLHDECEDKGKRHQFLDDYVFEFLKIPYMKKEITKIVKDNFWESIILKEKNYLEYNDEVINIGIKQRINEFKNYDYIEMQKYIDGVIDGTIKSPDMPQYTLYVRTEEDKNRKLVSLEAKERIITTALVNKLILMMQKDHDSYSYHLNLGYGGDVFYPWVSSWKRFKEDVSQYFIFNIFEEYHFIKIDVKSFYDSIYLQAMYNIIVNSLEKDFPNKEKVVNIYKYLVSFNEKIMISINENPKGVPQGPAYARVLAELSIDSILQGFLKKNHENIRMYRYVDDIYIFHNSEILSDELLKAFTKTIEQYNLFINKNKTFCFGKIKNMSVEDKRTIEEFVDFNYELSHTKGYEWGDEREKAQINNKFEEFLNKSFRWTINDMNFILSSYISTDLQSKYLDKHESEILSSLLGRGSAFRKYYKLVFSDIDKANTFFNKKLYQKVPVNSINFKNLIVIIALKIKELSLTINNKEDIIYFVEFYRDKGVETEENILLNTICNYVQ